MRLAPLVVDRSSFRPTYNLLDLPPHFRFYIPTTYLLRPPCFRNTTSSTTTINSYQRSIILQATIANFFASTKDKMDSKFMDSSTHHEAKVDKLTKLNPTIEDAIDDNDVPSSSSPDMDVIMTPASTSPETENKPAVEPPTTDLTQAAGPSAASQATAPGSRRYDAVRPGTARNHVNIGAADELFAHFLPHADRPHSQSASPHPQRPRAQTGGMLDEAQAFNALLTGIGMPGLSLNVGGYLSNWSGDFSGTSQVDTRRRLARSTPIELAMLTPTYTRPSVRLTPVAPLYRGHSSFGDWSEFIFHI
ncbi:uncharacterized protein PAC_08781 [Phialocephala subalpina]|uniref:Uncharacterized protein n=1 Tax=Phialocephala subalpina TaxID=576137 RepID=A0A1L7X1P6_9HELO|nr:uncharacterized protein PAC_08781 [Phialocephala subalpina]